MKNEKSRITAKRIKELRSNCNFTMVDLAEKVGVSKSTIAKWENGYVDNMRQDRVKKLAEIFNVSPAYIMGYDDIEQKEREQRFTERYSQLDEGQQKLVDDLIENFLSKK